MRECQECGVVVEDEIRFCPKCDAELRSQTDGSVHTVDVAHHHETVAEATDKLRHAVLSHKSRLTRSLRVVVGQGLIRDAVVSKLASMRAQRSIVSYAFEKNNRGAIIVKLKR